MRSVARLGAELATALWLIRRVLGQQSAKLAESREVWTVWSQASQVDVGGLDGGVVVEGDESTDDLARVVRAGRR